MTIEYETTLEDVVEYQKYSLTFPEVQRTLRKRALMTAFNTALVILVLSYTATKDVVVSVVPAVVMFLVVWAMAGSAFRHEALKRGRQAIEGDRTKSAVGPHTLEVDADAVTEVGALQTLSVKWPAIRGVVTTEHHTFIILHNLGAFIVPHREFPGDVAREAFVRFILEAAEEKLAPAPDL